MSNRKSDRRKPAGLQAPGPQEVDRLVAIFAQGQYAEAARLARALTERFPQHGFGWKLLGSSLKKTGRMVAALTAIQKAAALSPRDVEAHYNLGNTLKDLDRFDEAEASFHRALQLNPNFAEAYNNLGITLRALLRLDEAEASFRRALEIKPEFADAHNNLGLALRNLDRVDEAEASFRLALQIRPDYAEAHNNLGLALRDLDRLDEAEVSFRRALQIKPDLVETLSDLGLTLNQLSRLEEAEACFRQALEIKPDFTDALGNLGNTLNDLFRLDEAETCYRQVLKIKPNYAAAHNNLGIALRNLGRLDEAEVSLRQALQIAPDYVEARSALLFLLSYATGPTPSEYLAEARQYGQQVCAKVTSQFDRWSCAKRPERLRIGLVSGDFKNHPVGYFLESILTEIDPSAIELIAYPTSRIADELTARIRPHFGAWRSIYGKPDEAAARMIHSDGIHVLIDLTGHTGHYNRLPIFAWKPAPVQVSWLGYFASTGVPTMDYLIADPWTLPKTDDGHFTEKIWRLPQTRLCFTAPNVEISVSPLPALVNGYLSFGCFNALIKMNDAVVALWAKVLASVPDSRLFLKTKQFQEPSVRQNTVERFAAHGIAADRLILEEPSPRAEYLASYSRVDIALDPFPYTGGTTSAEGLWMGVPVLTLAGDRLLSRQGVGLLMNAGLPDWVAANADDYVARAVSHAGDLPRLAALRQRLRQQVLASPVFDAPRFARHFEAAMHGMWQEWEASSGLAGYHHEQA